MNYKSFSRENLPFNNEMLSFWENNGFLVINNFYSETECNNLIKRSQFLIEKNDFSNSNSIFDTVSQSHNDDTYFLDSGDKIRFFLENKSFDNFLIVGTPYLFRSFTFLHSKIAFTSGFFSAISIKRRTGCLFLLSIVTSPA